MKLFSVISVLCEPGSTRIFTLTSFQGLLFSPVYRCMVTTIRRPFGPRLCLDIHDSVLGRHRFTETSDALCAST